MSDIVTKKLQELAQTRRKILKTPEQALDLILDQKQPEILVRSFNPEDLHVLIKEIGVEDALPVVQMAGDAQWEYMLDVESWDKDRLNMPAVSRWLRYLYLADPDRFVKLALGDNLELVEVYLQQNLDVVIRDQDEDLSHLTADYFTIDDIFYVRIKADSAAFPPDSMGDMDRTQFLREFLNRLADEDYAKYQGMLLESSSLLTPEIEEELYRIKTGRLEDKGIPPLEEALGIYTMVKPEQLAPRHTVESNFSISPPLLPAALAQATPVYDGGLALPSLPEDFEMEFAALANSILVADQIKVNEREDMNKAVVKAMGYLRIAYETLKQNDEKLTPVSMMNRYQVGQLFSFGFSQALKLKWQAQAWLKESYIVQNKLGIKFYDEKGMGVLSGLFLKRPLYFDDFSQGTLYREFASLDDINATRETLEEVFAMDTLLKQTGSQIPTEIQEDDHYPLTWKNLLLTLWARHELDYEDNLEPLSTAALQDFWPQLLDGNKLQKTAKPYFKKWLEHKANTKITDKNATRALDKLFAELTEEYGSIDPRNLDAKHVTMFRLLNG